MNARVTEHRLKKAVRSLRPTDFKVIKVDQDTVTFRVVSYEFRDLGMIRRYDRLQELIEASDPYLFEQKLLIMECWTPEEWKRARIVDIGFRKKQASIDEHSRRVRLAIKAGRL